MHKWIKHAKSIEFRMNDMYVIWHVAEWNKKNPIISGTDDTLFIIDGKNEVIYTLSYGVLIKTKIVFTKSHSNKTHVFFTQHDKHNTEKLQDLQPNQWSHIMNLVKTCHKSRRWIMREQMNFL